MAEKVPAAALLIIAAGLLLAALIVGDLGRRRDGRVPAETFFLLAMAVLASVAVGILATGWVPFATVIAGR